MSSEKMTGQEYVEKAMRTANKEVSTVVQRLDNAALGLTEEIGEVLELWDAYREKQLNGRIEEGQKLYAKLIDELGDVNWYLALAFDALEMEFIDHNGGRNLNLFHKLDNSLLRALIRVGKFAGLVKKVQHHGHALGLHKEEMWNYLRQAAILIHRADPNVPRTWSINIAKLAARYEDGFDSEVSQNRYRNEGGDGED